MFQSETRTVISAGAWVPGAAFSHRDCAAAENPQATRSSPDAIGKFQYVGRLLIERMENHEMSSSSGTILFEGSSNVEIDAQGVWSVKKVLIT
jgi:hypothetical protein